MTRILKTGWHVLYVKSCQEKKVHCLLQEKQIEVFLPTIKTIRQWSDRKKTIFKPLFPSYVFVNITSAKEFHKALSVQGVCKFICFGNEYALLTQQEIQKIKLLVSNDEISEIKVTQNLPKVGDIRKILHGSLDGLGCEVMRVDNTQKIVVRIDSLHQNIMATIPSYYLEEALV
ncbi:UpxY family transcription antiterminator [Aquimarina aquimarini]|uniref:UpxY family transcription antiterminator n=1 Tax=Aquimarina aquimarini TaxID=1191734 RepID=UPI000D558E42|nr:UpxY family transcription antiterminator [Aquimarina aquimarini]